MERVRLFPSRAAGAAAAPPSKSMAIRALACAAFAEGESRIGNLAFSEDVEAAVAALGGLGADITVDRAAGTAVVRGINPREMAAGAPVCCGESASVLRFIIPAALLSGARRKFAGSARLFERPLDVYEEIFRRDGISWRRTADGLETEGSLKGGEYSVRGDISSQFISGMMLALPFLGEESSIAAAGKVNSAPYIDLTADMMKRFGVDVMRGEAIRTRGTYRPADYEVEGDWTNAAYLEAFGLAAACRSFKNAAGQDVAEHAASQGLTPFTVTGLSEDSLQGDRIYRQYFEMLRETGDGLPVIDISPCPDLAPVLMAAAAFCRGAVLTGTGRLAYKESDRGRVMAEELLKFGIKAEVKPDSIIIPRAELSAPAQPLSGHNDHRVVMALAVLCSVTGGVIEGAEAVKKSFPDFFEIISHAGIKVSRG